MTQAHATTDGHDAHPPHLAHHFDTPRQQFESGKLGMWVFLATEILMFGGLFCAYSVYRANHPEIFLYAHHYLDTNWGAINTSVLLISSFTMAWGVRAAQLGQRTLLITLLALTFLGGCGFMAIKAVEYQTKFSHDLGPGVWNLFTPQSAEERAHELEHLEGEYGLGGHGDGHGEAGATAQTHGTVGEATLHEGGGPAEAVSETTEHSEGPGANPHVDTPEPVAVAAAHSAIAPAAAPPQGINLAALHAEALPVVEEHGVVAYDDMAPADQARVHIFFQIYFLMTGLHGIHVVIGMGLIGWILVRSVLGHFGPSYFTPVDIVGLYWHLVDLIWIFLFPLLYLIH